MSNTLSMAGLLDYNAKHGVLICCECKYAIQKSAVGSHLLRHKIYREKRQRLLASIARLELLEPDDVQSPSVGSQPVDGLPIISGYRCTAAGCENLCASNKRLRRHWSESHGMKDPPTACARPVNMQTFFRGTKVRYFEVSSHREEEVCSDGDERAAQQDDPHVVATHASPAQVSVLLPSPPHIIELDTLRYFHHYITITSLILPAADNAEPIKYWQTKVVAQALQLPWLVSGLLAISASHLAMLSDGEPTDRMHQKRSVCFIQAFCAGWEGMKYDAVNANVEVVHAGAQISCILRCCHWTSKTPATGLAFITEPASFRLPSFIAIVQGCGASDLAFRSAASSDDMTETEYIRAKSDLEGCSDAGVRASTPSALLERLRTLPYRMAEALEKPDSLHDFTAAITAIDALVECCSLTYASEDVRVVWLGMDSWLRRLSDHFKCMVSRQIPAALIVLAHWTLLVERAERHFWFLKGMATKIRHQVAIDLPRDSTIQSLIQYLKD